MKTLFRLCMILSLALATFSCNRDYDGPKVGANEYDGPAPNITIAELKAEFAGVTATQAIGKPYYLEARVIGNDKSGNIFKQVYIQDATGAINIGVDQNSVDAFLRIGQNAVFKLEDLAMVRYAGQLQIGYENTQANRIPDKKFTEIYKPTDLNASKVIVHTIDLANIDDAMANQLVRINNVSFPDGGVLKYTQDDKTTNRTLKDAKGNEMDVRTSNYSKFAEDVLPTGSGYVEGILGKYNSSWQLFLRDKNDVHFSEGGTVTPDPDPEPTETVVYNETFGADDITANPRPKIAQYTNYDNKSVVYSDTYADPLGGADVRSLSKNQHVWFPKDKNASLVIDNIQTDSKTGLKLTFQLAANLFTAGESIDLNVVEVKINGVTQTMPSKLVANATGDNNKFHEFTMNVPAAAVTKLEFIALAANNTLGLRLDNIKIAAPGTGGNTGGGSGGGIVIIP